MASSLSGPQTAPLRPVLGVVSDGQCLVDPFIGEDAEDRPEDFFLGNGHIVGHIGEDRRIDEVPLFQAVPDGRRRGL